MKGLTATQQRLRRQVREFVAERIVPLEEGLDPDESDLDAATLASLVVETKAMGLYNYDVPAEHGGPGLDTVTITVLAMEMSQHRAGLYAPCYGAFGPSGFAQLYDASPEQRERFLYPALRGEQRVFFGLTEPAGGSDPAQAIATTAVRDGDDWVLNGTKIFIGEAHRADFGLVFARTGGPGRDGISCFVVETTRPGFEVVRAIHTLRAGTTPNEIRFTNVRVPHENLIGEEGGGFALANAALVRIRIPYSAACVGLAVASQSLVLEHVKRRTVFGKTLAEHEGVQWMLCDNDWDIHAASLQVLYAASRADEGLSFRRETALAKIAATEGSARVVDRSMQLFGAWGMAKDLPFERWYRELRIRRVGEGTTETQRMVIARDLLRAPTYTTLWED
ncbi:MAG: acyl-CoA dehydrogenase family protein [Acidimicrobiales bacterium]